MVAELSLFSRTRCTREAIEVDVDSAETASESAAVGIPTIGSATQPHALREAMHRGQARGTAMRGYEPVRIQLP